MTRVARYAVFALLLTLPTLSHGWGRQGHKTVALVAEGLLTPQALQMIDTLRRAPGWEGLEPGDSRYFKKADRELIRFCQGPDPDLSLIGDWADAWREHHPDTGRLHFVNIPLDGDGSDASAHLACGADCILTQTGRQILVLRDPAADSLLRLQALLWVVHLIGDVHQPLHCADHADRGGNIVPVSVEGRRGNLHAAWDTTFFEAEHAAPAQLAADLLAHECRDVPPVRDHGPGCTWAWAEESFQVAKTFVYPQVQRNQGVFSADEVGLAWPVLRKQLARAGVRLAAVLNAAAETRH